MHGLLMEGYTRSQIARRGKLLRRSGSPPSPAAPGTPDSFRLWPAEPPSGHTVAATADDAQPTYVPPRAEADDGEPGEARVLGCEHYRRNVKLQCSTCRRWYTCRLCHNDSEDHVLPRRETKNMLCMLCGHVQRVGEICVRCGVSAPDTTATSASCGTTTRTRASTTAATVGYAGSARAWARTSSTAR